MFSLFFDGIQRDLQIAILPPVLCALFRLLFIEIYRAKKSPLGEWRKWYHCFRYGFWWGMDLNAYFFLLLVLLVSLPGAFLPFYYSVGDTIRQVVVTMYAIAIYTAFLGKMIFYYHYHDIFNSTLWLGKNAEKHNLLDIFFHQDHGALLLLSYIPYTLLCWWAGKVFMLIPQLPYYHVSSNLLQITLNVCVVLAVVAIYYYFRYGGTFMHDDKPEWDTIPSIVKKDIFMARATVDDLVQLKVVLKHPLQEGLQHSDEEDAAAMDAIMPESMKEEKWKSLKNPVEAFVHTAKGARIKKPKHIFLIVGESYSQMPLDDIYSDYHIMDGAKAFRKDPHTAVLDNFLPAGMISRPAIVSLMTGIFDAKLELNEREDFWHGTLATTLPNQLRKLGYRSIYWYGGNPTYGNFDKYGPAVGFFGVCVGLFSIGTFTQVNGISSAVKNFFDPDTKHVAFKLFGIEYSWTIVISGIILTICVGLVIIGGLKRITNVAQVIVPFMAILYVITALLVIIFNIDKVPGAFKEIIEGAFGLKAAAGGTLGAIIVAMQKGIARGIFSNEAGLGSAPIAAAAAKSNEPVEQGLVSMLGTFIDTIIICTLTGLTIVIAGSWNIGLEGVAVTTHAFQTCLPFPSVVASSYHL